MRTLGLQLVQLVSTVVYLGLAVLGEGSFSAFFGRPAVVAAAVLTLVMGVAGGFSQGNLSTGVKEDRGNRWSLYAMIALGLINGFLPAYTDRIGFWTLDGETLRWVGVLIYAVGGVLRLWPVFVLGRRFSGVVAIQPGHTLVTTGIYSRIRHPSYLGLVVMSLGWSLVFRSGVGVLLTVLTLVPLLARIEAEECFLQAHFGAEYDAWRARTNRLLPGLF
jgi:protein-S-isoprenylcysteine O-methyltransferase Ste14